MDFQEGERNEAPIQQEQVPENVVPLNCQFRGEEEERKPCPLRQDLRNQEYSAVEIRKLMHGKKEQGGPQNEWQSTDHQGKHA